MSIYFIGPSEEELWNPGNQTAEVFCAQAQTIASLLRVPSGVGPMQSDEVRLELDAFGQLATALAHRLSAVQNGQAQHALLQGVASIVFALAVRLGLHVPFAEESPVVRRCLADGLRLLG